MAQNKLDDYDWTAVEIRTYDYVRYRCRTHGKTAEIRMATATYMYLGTLHVSASIQHHSIPSFSIRQPQHRCMMMNRTAILRTTSNS